MTQQHTTAHTADPSRHDSAQTRRALVAGATGYVGGRVVAELLERGWAVRTLSRDRDKALGMDWGDRVVPRGQHASAGQVEVCEGDAARIEDVREALEGVDAAWYLLHSMSDAQDFAQEEAQMARVFAQSAHDAGVGRIVYLGGLHPQGEELSEHLASRVQVGQILMASGVPTAALQAGVVLGEGSSSFSMLRHLAERLPGAIAPDWTGNRITPISVRDAVFYLTRAGELPPEINRTFDIGGPDTLPYLEMMKRCARAEGLPPRFAITAPVTTPGLASHWIGLVTPVSHLLARPLIGSLLHETVVKERDLEELVGTPVGGNQGFEEAVRTAVRGVDTRRWRKVLGATSGVVLACAVVGSFLSDPQNRWYRSLDLPSWQPPAAAFPIAWTALYADIAVTQSLVIADHLDAEDARSARADALALSANLVLNASWSGLFFRSRRPVLSTVVAGALAVSSADLVRRAWVSAPERGVLLSPYAGWTAFATVLNAAIARRNPQKRTVLGRLRGLRKRRGL